MVQLVNHTDVVSVEDLETLISEARHLASEEDAGTVHAVGISEATYYGWRAQGKTARDEPPPSLELSRQGLIDLLVEADVTYPARATKTVLLRLLTGIDEADIMRHTRHKSVQIMRRYERTSGLWIRNATTGVSL